MVSIEVKVLIESVCIMHSLMVWKTASFTVRTGFH